jgi:beta-glucosidase
LVVSWPHSVGQEPLYYNALNTGRPAANAKGEDKYLSRYIDEQNSPQFPFGYGLSYTSFRYGTTEVSEKQLNASSMKAGPESSNPAKIGLTASAEVTNIGQRSGDEIVQIYVQLRGTSVAQPVRALKGFQRVSLAPGETTKVRFALPADAFALWNDHNLFVVEPEKVSVWISPDSAHGTPAAVEIVP